MTGIHVHSPSECGGNKKLAIGDTIHFRVDKNFAYLQTDNGKEQKLRILSEGTKDKGAPEDVKP